MPAMASPNDPPVPALDAAKPPPGDDDFAAALRGLGPIGLLAIVVVFAGNLLFLPLSALLALVWAWRSRTPAQAIGLTPPRSWPLTTLVGLVFGTALKLAMKSLVMPLLGAPPINETFRFVTHNPASLPGMLYAIVVGAGF